ncbi:MAG: hypothetical protein HQL87_07195 [Magnetococcales bacterium]|nr:hypothetical protein [Magnetococcales bacterium]
MAEQSTAKPDEERSKKKSSPEDTSRKKCPTCKKGTPLWFISWADMVTLLLCLFVIIVAYSTQEKGKYLTLAGSMRDAFGAHNPDESMPPIAKGYHVVSMMFQKQITVVHIAEQVKDLLAALIEQNRAKVSEEETGVVVQIDRDALFQSEAVTLTEATQSLLTGLASVITLLPNTVEIRVARAETPGKPFDWDVGTAEAAAIAAVFEQQGGVLYNRIQVTSLVAAEKTEPGSAPQKERIEIRIMKTTNPEED